MICDLLVMVLHRLHRIAKTPPKPAVESQPARLIGASGRGPESRPDQLSQLSQQGSPEAKGNWQLGHTHKEAAVLYVIYGLSTTVLRTYQPLHAGVGAGPKT